jgi:uncharacterized protein (TIGR03546 family)
MGLSFGFLLGLSDFFTLQTLICFLVLLIFRINIGAALVSAFFFKFVAYLMDPVLHSLGKLTLEAESLRPLWISLYNMPIIPYTRFNNSIVMGELVLGFSLVVPMYFIFKFVITKYRLGFDRYINNLKIVKSLKATKIYGLYSNFLKYYGD